MIRRWLRRWLAVPEVRAIRGAITVPSDDATAIREAVLELLREVRRENQFDDGDVISAIFTVTPDLTAAFPAETARRSGWTHVPLLCMQEIAVPGGMPRCLRVLVHVQRHWQESAPTHVYLRDAATLRPDLVRV
ncbi:MAG: chorismate mutase [Gemmatimonadales bacterium]